MKAKDRRGVFLSSTSLTFSPQDRRDGPTGLCRQLPTPSQSPEKTKCRFRKRKKSRFWRNTRAEFVFFLKIAKIQEFQTSNIDMATNLLTTLQRVFSVTEHLELVFSRIQL